MFLHYGVEPLGEGEEAFTCGFVGVDSGGPLTVFPTEFCEGGGGGKEGGEGSLEFSGSVGDKEWVFTEELAIFGVAGLVGDDGNTERGSLASGDTVDTHFLLPLERLELVNVEGATTKAFHLGKPGTRGGANIEVPEGITDEEVLDGFQNLRSSFDLWVGGKVADRVVGMERAGNRGEEVGVDGSGEEEAGFGGLV